jgi:hypothetical protein
MSPRYPVVRTGEVTWDGVTNVIAEHIVYNNDTEVFPRFKQSEKNLKLVENTADNAEYLATKNKEKFELYLENQKKVWDGIKWCMRGIFSLLALLVGDLIWYWIKTYALHSH